MSVTNDQGDPLDLLSAMLEAAGAQVTLSPWCVSGFVGTDICGCRRCCGRRGERYDVGRSAREYTVATGAFRAGFKMGQRG